MLKKDELRGQKFLLTKDLGILQSLEVFHFLEEYGCGKKPQKNHQSIHVCRFYVFQNIFI